MVSLEDAGGCSALLRAVGDLCGMEGRNTLVPGCRGMLYVMKDLTRRLWEEQDRHPGDRL